MSVPRRRETQGTDTETSTSASVHSDLDLSLALMFANRASSSVHRKIKESLLTSTKIFQKIVASHVGFSNLCFLVLLAVTVRLIIKNLMKYGLLIEFGFWFNPKSFRDWSLSMWCSSLVVFPLLAFAVEKMAQNEYLPKPEKRLRENLKFEYRLFGRENVEYEGNVSFKNLAYFMVAPTLCYQPCYPRTPCIRKDLVFCLLIQLILFTGVMGFIIEQAKYTC